MTHELKTWPSFFEPTRRAVKSFEVRENDRDFKVGDMLTLLEYDPVARKHTGRRCVRMVTYILSADSGAPGLKPGFVVMSVAPLKAPPEE